MMMEEQGATRVAALSALQQLRDAMAGKAEERSAAFLAVASAASELDNHWPLYKAWSLMQRTPTLSDGEILDRWSAHKHNVKIGPGRELPADRFLTASVYSVWTHLERMVGATPAADYRQQDWFRFWLATRERARSAAAEDVQTALDECDALLELITSVFSARFPKDCASDEWVVDLREQAIAHAQYARCHVNPDNPLSLANNNNAEEHQTVMARALGAILRESVFGNAMEIDDATARLAHSAQGDRLDNAALQADRMGRVMRYWASQDPVVAYILKQRFGLVLGRTQPAARRIIPWVRGIEQGIALIGPPHAGKTSLMFASEHLTGHLVGDLPVVKVQHAVNDTAFVDTQRSLWKARKKFNTDESARLSAETGLRGLCSFGFFDLSGEEYFPQKGDFMQDSEVIRRRYATSPPTAISMILNGTGEPAKIGTAFDNLMQIIGQTAEQEARRATQTDATDGKPDGDSEVRSPSLAELNKARPVYFLIGKADLLVAEHTRARQEALLADAKLDERLVKALSAELTDHVIDLRTFGESDDSAVDPDLATRIRNSVEMCATPGRLRAVIDALQLTEGERSVCAATGHTNLYLLFVQTGAEPGGAEEFPPQLGVDTFWQHLWENIPPATAAARQQYLTRAFVDQPRLDLEAARKVGRHAEMIALPAWPTDKADALLRLIASRGEAMASELLGADRELPSLSELARSRGWSEPVRELLDAAVALTSPFEVAQADLDATLKAALRDLLVSLGTPVDQVVAELEGFAAAGPRTQGLVGKIEGWRLEFARPDAESFMFHGAHGALRGSSPLRSEPSSPYSTNPALAWLASTGDTLDRRLTDIFAYADNDRHEEKDAASLLREGLTLLADYEPQYASLAIALLEFDRTKVKVLVGMNKDIEEMRSRAIDAILALREAMVAVVRLPSLSDRLREAVALTMLGGVVRALGFDPAKLLAEARRNEGSLAPVIVAISAATDNLLKAHTAASEFEWPIFGPNKRHENVAGFLKLAWEAVSNFTTSVTPPLSAHPDKRDVEKEQRRFAFVRWYAQQLGASTTIGSRDVAAAPAVDAARNAVAAATRHTSAFTVALRSYVEGLRVAILKERRQYLIAGKLTEQLPKSSLQLLNKLFTEPLEGAPTIPQREARLSGWEATYAEAINVALEAINVALEAQPK